MNSRWLYLWLAGLALLPAIYFWLDPWTGEARAALQSIPWLAWLLDAIRPLGKLDAQLGLLAAFWLVALVRVRKQVAQQRFVFMLLCLLATGLAVQVVKVAVWRDRPNVNDGPVPRTWDNIACSRHCSFPSGDTATVFALATAAVILSPRVGAALFVLGFLVGASRIAAGAHHFADVWGGLLMGTAVPAGVLWWWRRREPRAGPAAEGAMGEPC